MSKLEIPEINCPNCSKHPVLRPTGEKEQIGQNKVKYGLKCPNCHHEYDYVIDIKPE